MLSLIIPLAALSCPATCDGGATAAAAPATAPVIAVAFHEAPEAPKARTPVKTKVAGGKAGKSEGGKDKSSSIIVQRNDERIAITVRDGEVHEATVNGERLPPDRIRRDGERVTLLGADGESIAEFRVTPGGGVSFGHEDHNQGLFKFEMPESEAPKPRPMIGVTLDRVGDALAEQLDLDQDEVVLITGVTAGMPAEKAGVQKGDIVVKIAGKGPASAENLRDAVISKKEGDRLALTVLRKGKETDVEIEIKEVTPERMGFGEEVPHGQFEWRQMIEDAQREGAAAGREAAAAARELVLSMREHADEGRQVLKEVHESLSREFERLGESLNAEQREKLKAELHRALERVQRSIERIEVDAPRVHFFGRPGQDRDVLITPPPPAPGAPQAPGAPPAVRVLRTPASPEVMDRLERLEDRLDRVQELLEKLAEEKEKKS